MAIGDVGALTSDQLWFDAAPGPWRLFAPPAWNRGSSFAHLDEDRTAHHHALMTPFLDPGEAHRVVDRAALAVLETLGYEASAPVPPFASEADFVHAVRSLVGRGQDEAALTAQVRSSNGLDGLDVLAQLFDAEELEHRQDVARLYRGVMIRPPDPAGLEFWTDVAAVEGLHIVADSFLVSPEFTRPLDAGSGLGDSEFIELLYQRVLERSADEQGREHWSDRLGLGAPRSEMAVALIDSVEYRQRVDADVIIDLVGLAFDEQLPGSAERDALHAALAAGGLPELLAQVLADRGIVPVGD